jgi:hypothetical protein
MKENCLQFQCVQAEKNKDVLVAQRSLFSAARIVGSNQFRHPRCSSELALASNHKGTQYAAGGTLGPPEIVTGLVQQPLVAATSSSIRSRGRSGAFASLSAGGFSLLGRFNILPYVGTARLGSPLWPTCLRG